MGIRQKQLYASLLKIFMTILYHYCSNNAFHSIIEKRSIWLSSLSLANDSMEGRLVTEILAKIAKEDGLEETSTQRLQKLVGKLDEIIDGLGFCLSEDGDLLSQWRGYASDATGVSIGFSKGYLERFAEGSRIPEKSGFTLQKVEYEYSDQMSLLKPTYTEIKEFIDIGAFKNLGKTSLLDSRTDEEIEKKDQEIKRAFSGLSMTVLTLFAKLFLLKTRAFSEEREWRLISYFVKSGDDPCRFRATSDRIVPYREYELSPLEESSIVEVIIGPKNLTPNYVIESFLNQNGFLNAKVLRSEATYR